MFAKKAQRMNDFRTFTREIQTADGSMHPLQLLPEDVDQESAVFGSQKHAIAHVLRYANVKQVFDGSTLKNTSSQRSFYVDPQSFPASDIGAVVARMSRSGDKSHQVHELLVTQKLDNGDLHSAIVYPYDLAMRSLVQLASGRGTMTVEGTEYGMSPHTSLQVVADALRVPITRF